MCTVTYLPKSNNEFILTHNRDEHFSRGIAQFPSIKNISNQNILTPIDSNAGGTWIATSQNYTLCLLNGGYKKHISQPPYRHSRGKIIIDFFEYNSISDFIHTYDINLLEPFTLILVDHHTNDLHECIFDGRVLHHSIMQKNQAHIWSSSTLYQVDDILRRKNHFNLFLQEAKLTQNEIIAFHTNSFKTLEHEDILINRNEILKTVSLTSIVKSTTISMTYIDFIQSKQLTLEL